MNGSEPTVTTLMLRLALALGVGLLIGVERGWQARDAEDGSRVAGVRTFSISGLLGGLVALLASGASLQLSVGAGLVLGAGFVAYAAVVTAFALLRARRTGSYSATSSIAALLTFALGAYAIHGDVRITAAAGVTAAMILTARNSLHSWVRGITAAEFQSTLLLLAMTCIALPVIPDRTLDWPPGLNPREIWIIAIALAGASFVGYVAAKLWGERQGVMLAAATAALVSSLAVILSNARRAAGGEGDLRLLIAACALASTISMLRVTVLSLVLAPSIMTTVGPVLLTAAFISGAIAFALIRTDLSAPAVAAPLRNPFSLGSTLLMAGSIAVFVVVGNAAHARFGSVGTLAGAILTGLVDVDAMTIGTAKLVQAGASPERVGHAVLAGAATNMLVKMLLGAVAGSARFALWLVVSTLLTVLAGAAVLWLLA